MLMKRLQKLLGVVAVSLAVLLPVVGSADSGLTIPPPVKGKQCVEPTDVMRRNHMDYLKHHRDETLREGIRTKQYSLRECIACHVAPVEASAGTEQSQGHFCMNCHIYTGIKPDCFQCHATKPEAGAVALPPADASALRSLQTHNSSALLNDGLK
jgi:hypothetical protein